MNRDKMRLKLDAELLDAEAKCGIQYDRCINCIERNGYDLDGFNKFCDVVKFEIASGVEYKDVNNCIRTAKIEANYAFDSDFLEFLGKKYVRLLIDREVALKAINNEKELIELEQIIDMYKEGLLTDEEFATMKKKLIGG